MITVLPGNNGVIVRTTNGGANWYLMTTGIFYDLWGLSFPTTGIGVVGTYQTILRTTNNGLDWQQVFHSPFGGTVYSIRFVDMMTGYAVGSGVLRTTNSGANWFDIGYSMPGRSIFFVSSTTGYVVGYNGNIQKTTNGGFNWFAQNSGVTLNLRCVFFVNATTGWAVGDSGIILKTTDGGGPIGVIPISNEIPTEFRLEQNYPNPFNPNTKFKIQIAKTGNVKIVVFDILGREIETLVNQKLQPGIYEFDWNASAYPSGVYLYRMTAGEYIQTKKMILTR
jgi:hypothetical protein